MLDIFIVLIGIVALVQFFTTFRGYRYFRGSVKRRSQDVTSENRPPVPAMFPDIEMLHVLGFQRLGESGTSTLDNESQTTWYFSNDNGSIYVELVYFPNLGGVIGQFNSVFPDNGVIETSYTIGENFDTPLFRSRKVTTNLSDAYQVHCQELESFMIEHGRPRPLRTMQAILEWEPTYRELHVMRKLRRPVVKSLISFLQLVVIFIFLAVVRFG